jgi:integrase
MVVEIPIHHELKAILDATLGDNMTFVMTEWGKPFTANGFGNWFRDRCDEAGLDVCASHGLRKAACRRLAEAGCTPHEIMAISGHKTLKEVTRYTSAVDRRHLAQSAMAKIESGTSIGKP